MANHRENDIAMIRMCLNIRRLIISRLYISELLIPMSEMYNQTQRSTLNGYLAVPRSKTAIFDGSFSCTAPRLWNQLPEVTKNAPSLSCFKTQIKQFMFNEKF